MNERKISLVTMSHGNPIALKKTLESFKGIVDEVVYGDLLIFQEDRGLIKSYEKEFNLRIIPLPFNYIFQMGFSNVLNFLISNCKNDLCLYMNTSEVIDIDYGVNEIVNNNPDCNTFYFSHSVEKHRWFRLSDRRHIEWSGRLHEEPSGEMKPYYKPIFQMKDEEKDLDNPWKAAVLNSCKEMVYWNQLLRIVDNPKEQAATNDYWVNYAKSQYQSMVDRLAAKGKQYEAFKTGDYKMFMMDIYSSDYFEKERFESNDMINFQGNRKIVL